MKLITRAKEYYRKNKPELTMGGAAAGAVFVVYIIINLIVWNNVSISYAFFFALVSFFLYFIVRRLFSYMPKKKKGVIEKKQ